MQQLAKSKGVAATSTNSATRVPTTDSRGPVSTRESWCIVPIDQHTADPPAGDPGSLYFVYGPRWGRLYLLSGKRAHDGALQQMLGLRGERLDALTDPVERILCDRAALSPYPSADVGAWLRAGYLTLHHSRRYLAFRRAATLIQRAARRRQGSPVPDLANGMASSFKADVCGARELFHIGRRVRDLEQKLGVADCYPRALITAYLCLLAGRDCVLTIGVLSPSRKMHVWCSTQGLLPYEPLPEHYLYQPLWSMTLVP